MKTPVLTRMCGRRRPCLLRACSLTLVAFMSAWIIHQCILLVPQQMKTPEELRRNVLRNVIFANGTRILHSNATVTNSSSLQTNVRTSLHPNFKYQLENPTLCSSTPDLKLVVVVHSAPLNVDNRHAIRSTWTNNSYFPDLGPVKVLFVLGQITNSSVQANLEKEFKQYGDILQGGFIDAYRNITYKAIVEYKWLTERCRNAKAILKVDDDIMVNTYKFMKQFLPKFMKTPRHISCRILRGSAINRNRNSKWYVSPDMFKGQTRYPQFCMGFTVVISNDVIPELYAASLTTDFFWIDDVFMYGLVPRKVKPTITYNSMAYGSDVIWGVDKPMKCYKTGKQTCPFLAVMPWVNVSHSIRNMWTEVVNIYQVKNSTT